MDQDKIVRAITFDCSCYSPEHALTFRYISGKDYKEVYACVYLNQPDGFFKRIWTSLKYLFGYKSKYGDFDTFILQDKDLDDMIDLLVAYRADIRKNNNP